MSLFSKATRFASSPQGRAAIEKAKKAANDPKNRAKIDDLVGKVKDRGRGGSAEPTAQPPRTTGQAADNQAPDRPAPGQQP